MKIIDNLVKQFAEQGIIIHKSQLSEFAYHIRIQSDSIKNADFLPGYVIRVGIGIGKDELAIKNKLRSYSVWDIDKSNGTLDLAICTQSNGNGANWAKECKIGDEVSFMWRESNFIIDDTADSYLIIGDLTSLGHLYMINRHLSDNKKVESILYSNSISNLFTDIDGSSPFSFFEMPENPYDEIIQKIEAIIPRMTGNKIIYIAGDIRICTALSQYFENNFKSDSIQLKLKAFWNINKKRA